MSNAAPGRARGDARSVRTAGRPSSKVQSCARPAGTTCAIGARRRCAAAPPALTPLRIEGSIRHPADGEPWEYTVVVSIRNDRGEEIARKLIGVGAMNPNEQRTFTLSVEAVSAKAKTSRKGRHAALTPGLNSARPPCTAGARASVGASASWR